MEGYNGTVFAYGQTSSGKTYTMMGDQESPGVIPRAIEDVFAYIQENSNQREFLLRVSYLEIYNETIRDLLSPENQDLKLHEDKQRGIYVSPLREDIVTSPEQVMQIIQDGEAYRHVSTTDYNDYSSRSHTVFQLIIESREKALNATVMSRFDKYRTGASKSSLGSAVRISALNLIDLAGSEKASSSADRRREGAFINKSLLTLGTVISKLTDEKSSHIPFRDSKLTRLLQPSLQGNARISVLCTISPAMLNQEESTNTLKFAQRIKKIVTSAITTEIMDDKALLQKYRGEIDELRNQLCGLSTKDEEKQQLAAEKDRLESELHQQQLVRTALKERIDHLTKLILTSSSFNPNTTGSSDDNDVTAKAAARKLNRMSMIGPSMSTSDSGKQLNVVIAENARLKEELAIKDEQLANLQRELDSFKSTSRSAGGEDAASAIPYLTDELQRSKKTVNEHEVIISEHVKRIHSLETELMRFQTASPANRLVDLTGFNQESTGIDPDVHNEVVHANDVLKGKVDDLLQKLQQKDEQVTKLDVELFNMRQTDSHRDISTNSFLKSNTLPSPPKLFDMFPFPSPNAQLLSSLLPPSPTAKRADGSTTLPTQFWTENGSASSFCNVRLPSPIRRDSVGTITQIKNLEENLEKERQLRKQGEDKSTEDISLMETELTLAKTELSISQMNQVYASPGGSRKSSLMTERRNSAKSRSTDLIAGASPSTASQELKELLDRMK